MPRGRTPREYPREIVELVCGMYRDGMTVAEICRVAPEGYRVQTILERYLPERRAAVKRNQRGDANYMWRGDGCGYQAAHLRLAALFGSASSLVCADCGARACDWSYEGGCSAERRDGVHPSAYCTHPDHYRPRCRPCHRAHDRREARHA